MLSLCACEKNQLSSTAEKETIVLLGDEAHYGNIYDISRLELTAEQREQLNKEIISQLSESTPTETTNTTKPHRTSQIEGAEQVTRIYSAAEIETADIPYFTIEDDNLVYIDNWEELITSGLSADGSYYIKYYIIDYFTHFLGKGIYHVEYIPNSYIGDTLFPWFYVTTTLNGKSIDIRCIYNVSNKCYYFECIEIGNMTPT